MTGNIIVYIFILILLIFFYLILKIILIDIYIYIKMREYFLDIPTIIIGIIIYIFISKLSISRYFETKEKILILFVVQIFGLIYDGLIILLGFSMSEGVLMFFNQLRFIFHGILVPLLILFSGYALDLKNISFYINLFINIILSIIGLILGAIAKLKIVEDTVLKRCTFANDIPPIIKIIFTVMNIGSVIYMIVVGIILFLRKKDYFFFLSGLFMLIFSAIGPATGNADLNYLLSMYGEVLMIIFLYLFFIKKEKIEQLESNYLEVIN